MSAILGYRILSSRSRIESDDGDSNTFFAYLAGCYCKDRCQFIYYSESFVEAHKHLNTCYPIIEVHCRSAVALGYG